MDVTETGLPGVLKIVPRRFHDSRGFLTESWQARRLAEAGVDLDICQENHSCSAAPGTVRGLHYQAPPMAQAKLVRVIRGAVLDVAVDIRRGSPSYGCWVAEELSADNGVQMLVPRGFLHGFVTRAPDTEVLYKLDNFFDPGAAGAVRFDDPDLGIDWGLAPGAGVLSEKDATAPAFRDFETPFVHEVAA